MGLKINRHLPHLLPHHPRLSSSSPSFPSSPFPPLNTIIMAASSSSLLFPGNPYTDGSLLHRSPSRVVTPSHSWFVAPAKPYKLNTASPLRIRAQRSDVRKEDVVIVGAGIAGLATAVSLQRLGVRSLVLEQADSLRTGGTSLTLFKNGWGVLDAIGVASDLRPQFLEIQGMVMKTEDGRELRSFRFKDEDASQEVRAVERRILLETLADKLPSEAICFSSKLENIETTEDGNYLLQLYDGTRLLAKIVIGCDGIRSPVARWMGFSEPRYVGHCVFRGLGSYSNGQPFEPRVNYVYGRGLRAGYVPISPTKVYWFICYNSSSPGPKITDPSVLKKQAKELVKGWLAELRNLIDISPDETISKTLLVDRWLWPVVSPPASKGRVVLVGDAWHPMTPNLGQGACCALEDSVVLARKLANGIDSGPASVEEAFRSYGSERWPRIFPLTIRANLVGSLLQWENPVACSVRNNIVIPKLVRLGPVLEHTNFECEPLLEGKF